MSAAASLPAGGGAQLQDLHRQQSFSSNAGIATTNHNNNSASISFVPTSQSTLSLEDRVRAVAGQDVSLQKILVKTRFLERDPIKLRDQLVKDFNKNVTEPVIINAGARPGTRVDPGFFLVAHCNKKAEIRAGVGERLALTLVAGYTETGVIGGGDGIFSQNAPLIGDFGTYLVSCPQGKYARCWIGQQPLLLDEGAHIFHDPLFKADPTTFLVDQGSQYIHHGILHVVRVPAAHYAKVSVNTVPLLLPYRQEPYVFNTALFKFDGNVPENAPYIDYAPLHVLRVPAGSVAKVWQGSKPLLLEYRESAYFFDDPSFRAEKELFSSSTAKLITHGSILRLRPGVTGDLEKAVVQSDGEIRFIDRFTTLDSVHDACLGFLNMGIRTCVFPSRATREERRRDTKDATSDDINFEQATTRDSLRIGMKLLVAFQVSDPGLVLSKLRLGDIEPHVENLAVSDMVRAVQHVTSQNFVNAISHENEGGANGGSAGGQGAGLTVADRVRAQLEEHMRECGLALVRFNIEEAKVLDPQIAKEMAKQSLVSATANAEQAVLVQRAAIARASAEVDAMQHRVKQEQQNQMKISAAQADLESSRLRGQAHVVEAEAKAKAAALEGALLREYPELLQLRLATLQFESLGRSTMTIVAPELASTPYALGAQGLWAAGAAQKAKNDRQVDALAGQKPAS